MVISTGKSAHTVLRQPAPVLDSHRAPRAKELRRGGHPLRCFLQIAATGAHHWSQSGPSRPACSAFQAMASQLKWAGCSNQLVLLLSWRVSSPGPFCIKTVGFCTAADLHFFHQVSSWMRYPASMMQAMMHQLVHDVMILLPMDGPPLSTCPTSHCDSPRPFGNVDPHQLPGYRCCCSSRSLCLLCWCLFFCSLSRWLFVRYGFLTAAGHH